jgi:ADP-heptose:LPS heptosyltransferase
MVDLLAALAAAFGADRNVIDKQPAIALTDAERAWAEQEWAASAGRRILINVSAGTSARLWANEKYVAVMRHFRQLDETTVFRVIGAPAEASRAESIAQAGGGVFVRTPSIRHAFALVATADFVFTPDTSIAHAASAFGIPTVAMYLRGTSQRWGLYGIRGVSVEHPEANLDTLQVDRVTAAIDSIWSDAPVRRRG